MRKKVIHFCVECGSKISKTEILNGKRVRVPWARKHCTKCVPLGTKNTRIAFNGHLYNEGKRQCAKCDKILPISHFQLRNTKHKRVTHSYCKQCERLYNSVRIREIKQKCVEYKGGKCMKCGYCKSIYALDFHHRNPEDKTFTISAKRRRSMDLLIPELDKCDLLCSNCHRETLDPGLNKEQLCANSS